jgi:hypothetical protein
MWCIWIAIILLFSLVLYNRMREGLTSSQLYEAQKIINNESLTADDKMAQLYGDKATVDIIDAPIIDILKDTATENEDKINNLQLYFVNLVNERNNGPESIYSSIPDKITSDTFFDMNNIINNPEFDKATDQVLQINNLGIQESTFIDILTNNAISDEIKINGDPENGYTGNTLSSLINQVLFGTFSSSNNGNPGNTNEPAPAPAKKKKKKKFGLF